MLVKRNEISKAISSFKTSSTLTEQAKELTYRQSLQGEIIRHLDGLSTKDKKRLIEAVVSPESGGKIHVRYLTGDDLVDDFDFNKYQKEDLYRPLTDREPVLEYDFKVDINGIMALISSLKHKDLFNQTSRDLRRLEKQI